MCGIAGICNFKEVVSEDEIVLLNDAVKHRGPDGSGIWLNDEKLVAFGHRRLSIMDLSENGKQPMSYANGRLWITFNGEIYNFLEIKKELAEKGYSFHSDSDTEVILAAYQEWGKEMLKKFNGMWAFAIYDNSNNNIFLSRDRFGIKPLYYFKDENKLMFSSEVQAIHKILGNKHSLNKDVIKDVAKGGFLSYGSNQTYLQNVFSLPGGHNLTLNESGDVVVEEWYVLNSIEVPKDIKQQAIKLKELLQDSCALRLRSDVPIATCLSGGLDSGSITAVINKDGPESSGRFSNYTHRGFCAAFPNTPIDESAGAMELAKKLQSKLDVVNIIAPTKEELEEALAQCDGPKHALAFFPIWSLYKYIKKQGITVTLDGQGPDEMLGGYRPVYEALSAAVELKKVSWFVDIYNTYAAQGESDQFSSKSYARKVLVVVLFKKAIVFAASVLAMFGFKSYKKGLAKLLGNKRKNFILARKEVSFTNSLDQSLFSQFFYYPLPGILSQFDRCSMSHGVECRMPFMDYRIVEFIFSLPPESKVGGGYTKRVLREALKGILPDETRLNKLKIGFNAPIVNWFREPLKDFMLEQINSSEFAESKFFDGKKLKKEFEEFLKNPKPQWDAAWKFWPPVHLVWWMRYNNISE